MSSRFEYRLAPWKALALACCALAVVCGTAWGAGSSVPIKGRIVDVDGKPVPGVTVRLAEIVGVLDYSGVQKGARVSGSSGEFDFGSVQYQREYPTFVLVASKPDEFLGWSRYNPVREKDVSNTIALGRLDITVSKPTTISGRVVDADGKPIIGAAVSYGSFMQTDRNSGRSFNYSSGDQIRSVFPLAPVTTDAEGQYSLPNVPSHMTVTPSVSMRDYAMMHPARVTEQVKEIVMVPGGSISGKFTNQRGKGCAGVLVTASSDREPRGWGKAISANDGSFQIDGLIPGQYRMNYYTERADHMQFRREGVSVKAHMATPVGSVLLPDSVKVTGRVLDADTGAPIAGAEIDGSSAAYGGSPAKSAKDGSYSLYVLPGDVPITYRGGNPLYMAPDLSTRPKPVTVPAGGLRYDIRLKRGEVASGAVLSPSGKPIAGISVSVGLSSNGTSAMTDAQGWFRIAVPQPKPGGG